MTQALRIVKLTDRPAQSQEDGLQRLVSIMRIPDWMFARGLASTSAEEVTWECPTCGIVKPRKLANGYRRRECSCQWEQREFEMREANRRELKTGQAAQHAEHTYTWLGAEEPGLENKTFGNFDHKVQPDAFKTAITYNPLEDSRNLLFMGSVGTGKTHLVAAILNGLRAQGVPCLFATIQGFFDAYYAASFDGKLSLKEQFGSTKLAALDDIDKGKADGKYQMDVLFDLFDRRYKRGLPTLLTTNAQESLDHWLNEAALDRLYERCEIVVMNGTSYRRVLAEQRNQRQK